jgi:DNA topoisomerase-1
MDYNYTSQMEKKLDEIANKKLDHIEMLKDFYSNFKKELDAAYIDSGCHLCEKCNSPMSERKSKTGNSFLGCNAYPLCKFAKNIE